MAEEAGVRFIDLDQELIRANAQAQAGQQSHDFYKTVNSYLVCSCSYFDIELIKRKFFNKTSDFLRKSLTEIDLLSTAEKEAIALAVLSCSESGLDLVLETTAQDVTSSTRHKIQSSLWQNAKLIIKRIKILNGEKQKLQNSIAELELV
jgi:adenine/guanine phosphoribosyltransferase-like PRPP-binding protein